MYEKQFNGLFAPLDKKYCIYFYFLSVLALILMFFSVISIIFLLGDFQKHKYVIMNSLSSMIMLGISYFSNRLLFTMCSKSL